MHLLCAVLLLGNTVVTAAWKLAAVRHGDAPVVAFAKRMVALTDLAITLPGVVLTLTGAHGMGWLGGSSLWQSGWIAWGHALFILSGVIWLMVMVPTQLEQGRLAASSSTSTSIPARYWQLNRRCIGWEIAATILPLVNMGLMVFRPQ